MDLSTVVEQLHITPPATERKFVCEFGSHPLKGKAARDIDVLVFGYTDEEATAIVREAYPDEQDKHIDIVPASGYFIPFPYNSLKIPVPCGGDPEDLRGAKILRQEGKTQPPLYLAPVANFWDVSSILRGYNGDYEKIVKHLEVKEAGSFVTLSLKEGDVSPVSTSWRVPSDVKLEENMTKVRAAAKRLGPETLWYIYNNLSWGMLLQTAIERPITSYGMVWLERWCGGHSKQEISIGRAYPTEDLYMSIAFQKTTDMTELIAKLYGDNLY